MESVMRSSHDSIPSREKGYRFSAASLLAQRTISDKRDKRPIEAYDDWVAVVRRKDGSIEMRSSTGMKRYKHDILEEAARRFSGTCKFLDMERENLTTHQAKDIRVSACSTSPGWHDHIPPHMQEHMLLSKNNTKRRRLEEQPLVKASNEFEARLPIPISYSGHVGSASVPVADVPPNEPSPARTMITIRVDQHEIFKEWLGNAFRAIQQQSCRLIAKEWIKLIHPKKQSTHPYNGNMPRNKKRSPERTKPPYWPADVQHKEPDHIDKDDRTKLLVHLLMCTPQKEILAPADGRVERGREIKADEMLATLAKTKKEELLHKWDIIVAVVEARTKFESYEEGGLDANTEVHVVRYQDPGASTRKPRTRSTATVRGSVHKDQDEDNQTRPSSPMPSDSPAESAATNEDSGNDDDISALNTSFSSTATNHSSGSSRFEILQKVEQPNQTGHIPSNQPLNQQFGPPFEQDMYSDVNLGHLHSTQSLIQDGWSPNTVETITLNGGFPRYYEPNQPCSAGIYSIACDTMMDTTVSGIPYHEPSLWHYNGYEDLNLHTNDVDQNMDPMQNTTCYQMHTQPRPSRLSRP